jgi:hypothetical protein
MSVIPSPALALARAFDRFERSSARMLNAAQGVGESDLAAQMVEQRKAVLEVKAAVATVRLADEMWQALLDLGKASRR